MLFIQAVAEADQSLFLEMATKSATRMATTHTASMTLTSTSYRTLGRSISSRVCSAPKSQTRFEVATAGKQMHFQNEQLSEADRLSDKVLVMALLTKLPHEYTEFVKIYLHGSRLPSFSELLKCIEDESTINSLRGGGTSRIAPISRGGGKPSPAYACRNCSVKGDHWGHDPRVPEADRPLRRVQPLWVHGTVLLGQEQIHETSRELHGRGARKHLQDVRGIPLTNSVMVGRKII